jgi:hypothetical protein
MKIYNKVSNGKLIFDLLWQLKMAYRIPLVLATMCIMQNKLHKSLKLLNLCPVLYILMQKAEYLIHAL